MVGSTFGPQKSKLKSPYERAVEAIEFVEFSLPVNTPAEQLNTVQLKRMDLARAISCKPKLLLLDELASGLTPGELDPIMDLIMEIRDSGVTIIAVEHIMRVIQGICDEVMVIEYGSTIARGTPKEVLENPTVIEAYLGEEEVTDVRTQ
jgi:branched-chain amino acid transport system ATP-binding protein